MKATRFTIDRSKWARGGEEGTQLLNPENGRMCCLGFYALACGADVEHVTDTGEYQDLHPDSARLLDERLVTVTDWSAEDEFDQNYQVDGTEVETSFIRVNDDTVMPDETREKLLGEMFASIGVTVDFVDGAP